MAREVGGSVGTFAKRPACYRLISVILWVADEVERFATGGLLQFEVQADMLERLA